MTELRFALSDHDPSAPATPAELRQLAAELEEVCINNECQFSHPDWRYVDGLRALAAQSESATTVPDVDGWREKHVRAFACYLANYGTVIQREKLSGIAEEYLRSTLLSPTGPA